MPPPDLHCSPCDVSWPELDHETTRKCPECGSWLDHVPEDLRDGPRPFDTSPAPLEIGDEVWVGDGGNQRARIKAISLDASADKPYSLADIKTGVNLGWYSRADFKLPTHPDEPPPRPPRYILIVEGDGITAARLLEEAGLNVTTVGQTPGAPRSVNWKEIALWLADCTAATAEHEGRLKRTSKSSATRMREVCRRAATAIMGGPISWRTLTGSEAITTIHDRLLRAAEEPEA